jgi:hypothetical protein
MESTCSVYGQRQTATLNYEISTVWEIKKISTTNKTSQSLMWPELVTGEKGRNFLGIFGTFRGILKFLNVYCTIFRRTANDVPLETGWETMS